jgi:hypothetical protein
VKKILLALIGSVVLSHSSLAMIGGQSARGEKYSAVVGIPNCTAVFIHPQVLLTAAHCYSSIGTRLQIYLQGRGAFTELSYSQKAMHPLYDRENGYFDVAYILLRKPVRENLHYPSLFLADVPFGQDLTIVGMGMASSSRYSTLSEEKKFMHLPYVGSEQDLVKVKVLNGQGACFGDSGGALLQENALTGELSLVGTATKIDGACGETGSHVYYHKISESICWVQQETGIFLSPACSIAKK